MAVSWGTAIFLVSLFYRRHSYSGFMLVKKACLLCWAALALYFYQVADFEEAFSDTQEEECWFLPAHVDILFMFQTLWFSSPACICQAKLWQVLAMHAGGTRGVRKKQNKYSTLLFIQATGLFESKAFAYNWGNSSLYFVFCKAAITLCGMCFL